MIIPRAAHKVYFLENKMHTLRKKGSVQQQWILVLGPFMVLHHQVGGDNLEASHLSIGDVTWPKLFNYNLETTTAFHGGIRILPATRQIFLVRNPFPSLLQDLIGSVLTCLRNTLGSLHLLCQTEEGTVLTELRWLHKLLSTSLFSWMFTWPETKAWKTEYLPSQ